MLLDVSKEVAIDFGGIKKKHEFQIFEKLRKLEELGLRVSSESPKLEIWKISPKSSHSNWRTSPKNL